MASVLFASSPRNCCWYINSSYSYCTSYKGKCKVVYFMFKHNVINILGSNESKNSSDF